MANILKKQVAKILEKDVQDEEFDHFMIILDQNAVDWENKRDVSTAEVSQNVQNFFLSNIQGFLNQYSPLYNEFKEIITSVNELDKSLNRMEECMSELRIKNMIILSKLQKLQGKEAQIDEKISLLTELISKITIEKSQLETFLKDDTPINETFIEFFDALDSIEEIYSFLAQEAPENAMLKNSLLKNTQEIKSIGFTKLLKYLNRNVENVPHDLLKKSIQLIMKNHKMQENLQKIIQIRKNVLNNHFRNLGAKQGQFEDESEFFWILIKGIEETFENELDLFNGEEKMEMKSIELLFEDIFRSLQEKLDKYVEEENHNFLEAYKVANYFSYLEVMITTHVNSYAPGHFETAITSRLRAFLGHFSPTISEYFKKRLEKSIIIPSDASHLDLSTFLPVLYDNLDKIKVILRFVDSSFLPINREEKTLPLTRGFFIPSHNLLMAPLNKAMTLLLNLPKNHKAREGFVHVIILLSSLEKIYRDLKLAVKKMDELNKSQENVKAQLQETIVTLCALNLRELLAEYEVKKDQIQVTIEGDKIEVEIDPKQFVYKDDVGKLVRICVAICKNSIQFQKGEAEAWLDEEVRRVIDKGSKEVMILLYEKALNKLLNYAEETRVGEDLVKKLEKIFDVEEGKIKLEEVEVIQEKLIGRKNVVEEDIEANRQAKNA